MSDPAPQLVQKLWNPKKVRMRNYEIRASLRFSLLLASAKHVEFEELLADSKLLGEFCEEFERFAGFETAIVKTIRKKTE